MKEKPSTSTDVPQDNPAAKIVNSMCAVIWADKDGIYSWYFENTKDYNSNLYLMENLSQTEDNSNTN